MKIKDFGGGGVFKWNKEYLVQLLSSGPNPILTDAVLINAIQKIDRKDFVPKPYEERAYDDVEIDIGYGEKLNKPTLIASMLSFLKPKVGGKYLDIGSGTGYSAAVLAFAVGDQGKVYSIERVQWLWEKARENMKKYPNLRNLQFLYRDGLEGLVNQAPFDGIHIAFSLETIPENLKMQLRPGGGRLVCPQTDHYLKVIERRSIDEYIEEVVPGFTLDKAKIGTA